MNINTIKNADKSRYKSKSRIIAAFVRLVGMTGLELAEYNGKTAASVIHPGGCNQAAVKEIHLFSYNKKRSSKKRPFLLFEQGVLRKSYLCLLKFKKIIDTNKCMWYSISKTQTNVVLL